MRSHAKLHSWSHARAYSSGSDISIRSLPPSRRRSLRSGILGAARRNVPGYSRFTQATWKRSWHPRDKYARARSESGDTISPLK